MPSFVCDKCETVENTALGTYWYRKPGIFEDQSLDGLALCSECTPAHFSDGSKTRKGVWHGKFPKIKWDGKRPVINR